MLTVNPVFITDVYKLGHIHLYPKGLTKVYSTLIPRSNKYMKGIDTVVSFGIEMFVQKWLVDYWNDNFFNIPFEEIEREYKVIVGDMLGEDNASVDHLRKLHELGYLPLRIKAIEEGKSVPIGTPIATVENTHEDFPWLVNYIETVFISEVYVPTTVATVARELKSIVSKHAELTSDSKDHLIWQCHDFSERGQHGNGASQLSCVAHLTSFAGSDTIQASNVARKYYNASNMVKRPLMGSVLASEHSVMQSYGSKNEFECYETLINENRNGILSLVSDTYDYFNVIDNILPSLKDSIMARNGKVVVRPDSGDPKKVLAGNGVIYIDIVSNSHDAMRSFKESIYLSMPISKDKFDSIEFIENFEDVLDNLMIGSNIETGYEFDDKYQYSLYKHKAILSYQFEEELRYVPIEFGTRKSKETNENGVYVNLDVDRKITNEDLGSLHILYKHFGGSKNSKGYFVLDSHIGLLFGEGFDRTKMEEVLTTIAIAGFSTENVVFGVGAYIYSVNVTRDSFGFAFKSQMVVVEGEERMIYKNPKGDSSKRSLRGGVAVMDWKGMKTTYQDLSFKELKEIDESGEDLLKLVYLDGERKLHTDFEEIITRIENKE